MEEIEKYLQEDEIILWQRNTIENLLHFIEKIIIFIVLSFIVIPIFAIFFFFIGEGIYGVTLITVFSIADGVLVCLTIYNYKKRKKRLHLTYKELKNYEEYVVLTNKRFIRRNYYLNFKVNLSRYILENHLEKRGDIIFLKLENIKVIIVEHNVKEINFLFHDEIALSPFYIRTLEMDPKEINSVMEILTELLNLERVEQYPGYERFVRKD